MPPKKLKERGNKTLHESNQRNIQFYFKKNQSNVVKIHNSSESKIFDDKEKVTSQVLSKTEGVINDTSEQNKLSVSAKNSFAIFKRSDKKQSNNAHKDETKNRQVIPSSHQRLDSEDADDDDEKTPYYMENFLFVLKAVFQEEEHRNLFDTSDMKIINSFHNLSSPAQKFYVRLFQRKQRWHRVNKLYYPNISNDLTTLLTELQNSGLLDNDNDLNDMWTVLEMASVGELKMLTKEINVVTMGSKNKKDMIQRLCDHSKTQKSIFSGKSTLHDVILTRSKKCIGSCYKVSKEPRKVFLRILLLFSLVHCNEDDDEVNWNQNPLLMMLLVNMGKTAFPKYEIWKETPIFETRAELIRYTNALQLEGDLLTAIEKKDWQTGFSLFETAFHELQSDNIPTVNARKSFLQRFSASHVYCRCVSHGVDILQKTKDYNGAVEKLRWLINQKISVFNSRGRWYDRLALNLDQHLKCEDQAISVIKEGLMESDLREHHKLSLSIRANRIKNSTAAKKKNLGDLFDNITLIETPSITSITIQGLLLPRFVNGMNTVFIRKDIANNDCREDFAVCSVERVALDHYMSSGYNDGIHGEGSTFITIYGLLFWDIIYCEHVPDVFRVPYQPYPLDLNSNCFYETRKTEVDDHLQWLNSSTNMEIEDVIKKNWEKHVDEVSLVKWDRFTDLQHLLSLVKCMNGRYLSCICTNLAMDYRNYRSGFPDLVVWNDQDNLMKIVEVKGPGDRLSTKQMIWLDHLREAGIPCEVCYVEGTLSFRFLYFYYYDKYSRSLKIRDNNNQQCM